MTKDTTDQSKLVEIAQQQAIQGEQIKTIQTSCKKIEGCLLGHGDSNVGMVTKVDRLEQKDKFRSRVLWLMFTVVIGLVIKSVVPSIVAILSK